MYEKYEVNKITNDLQKELFFLWETVIKDYKSLFLIEHKDCSHTEVEMNIIILKNIINDLSSSYIFSGYFSQYVYKAIANFSFNFINGFSMMPDLNPADFVINKTVMELDEIKEGDIVGGADRQSGMGCLHKVVHKLQDKIITLGNSNKSQEYMSKDTIQDKVILRIERETEMWNFLVKNPNLNKLCIESIDSTLADKEVGDEKEVEYLKNLKKRLEGESAKT